MSDLRQLAKIAEQRSLGWPDFHPEDFCHRCGLPNLSSWYVNSTEWQVAVSDVARILCPQCFVALWKEATGFGGTWELRLDPLTDQRIGDTEVRTGIDWGGRPYSE